MAERGGRKAWIWIGAGVAVIAVWLAFAMSRDGGPSGPGLPGDTLDPVAADSLAVPEPGRRPGTGAAAEDVVDRMEEMRAAVRRYEAECAARLEPTLPEGLGDRVAECIRVFGEALEVVVAADTVGAVAIDERVTRYRQRARDLEATPPGAGRMAPTRAVLISATETLDAVAAARYSESLDADEALGELEASARSLDPDRPLAAQQDGIRRYFLRAGELLSAMVRPDDPGPDGP